MKYLKIKFPDSGYRCFLLSYPALIVYSCIIYVFLFAKLGVYRSEVSDTPSYISAASLIFQGIPDVGRTPVYPIFIGIVKYIFGNYWDNALSLIQYFIFLISAIYLYKVAKRLGASTRLAFWLVFLYIDNPGLIPFPIFFLTECLAMTGIIFLSYSVVRILPRPKSSVDTVWPVFWLFILVFLRPALLYLIPLVALLFAYLIFTRKLDKRSIIITSVGFLVVIGSLIAYQRAITKRYNIHTISCVSLNNNYCTIRYSGCIDHTLAEDPQLREIIKSTYSSRDKFSIELASSEYDTIVEKCGLAPLDQYETAIIKKYPKDYVWAILDRWYSKGASFYMIQEIPMMGYLHFLNIFIPNMGTYNLLLVLYGIFIILLIKRTKKIPVMELFLYLICCGLLFTTIIGAQAEYTRLNAPAMPAFFLIMTSLFIHLRIKWFVRN